MFSIGIMKTVICSSCDCDRKQPPLPPTVVCPFSNPSFKAHHNMWQQSPLKWVHSPLGEREWTPQMGRKQRDKSIVSLFLSLHLSSGHIPAPLPHNEPVIPPHNKETSLGTSAVSEEAETNTGSWEWRSRSALPSSERSFIQANPWWLQERRLGLGYSRVLLSWI